FGELGRAAAAARGLGEVATLEVDRLSPDEAAVLARSLLGAFPPALVDGMAQAVAREAEGSPFFVTELVRSIEEEGLASPGSADRAFAGVSLEGILSTRVGRLSEEARRLLAVLSVAARPIEQGVCARAAEVAAPDAPFGALRAAQLVRSRGLRP